jgi:hypothetical protein
MEILGAAGATVERASIVPMLGLPASSLMFALIIMVSDDF